MAISAIAEDGAQASLNPFSTALILLVPRAVESHTDAAKFPLLA
jgi:hypothetical protein